MSPVAMVLLLVGYLLALPIAFRMVAVVRAQNRVAMFGHQVGVAAAALGWLAVGRPRLILIHGLWALIAIIWFNWAGSRR